MTTEKKPYAYAFYKLHDDSFGRGWERHIETYLPSHEEVKDVVPLYDEKYVEALEGKYVVLLAMVLGMLPHATSEEMPEDIQEIAGGVIAHIEIDDSVSAENTVYQPLRDYLKKFPKVIPE